MNGRKQGEITYEDGKLEGLANEWDENGQKRRERTYKDGKKITAVAWRPNGEKCLHTNVVNGNGVVVYYKEDGTESRRVTHKDEMESSRTTYKDGERVSN